MQAPSEEMGIRGHKATHGRPKVWGSPAGRWLLLRHRHGNHNHRVVSNKEAGAISSRDRLLHPSRFMGTVGGKVAMGVNSNNNEENPLLPLLTVAETKDCEILEGIPAEVDLVGQEDRLEEDLEGHLEDHLEDDPEAARPVCH